MSDKSHNNIKNGIHNTINELINSNVNINYEIIQKELTDSQYLDEKEHWIRFRNVGESGKLLLDYLEFVPLNIISDPTKPEDRH